MKASVDFETFNLEKALFKQYRIPVEITLLIFTNLSLDDCLRFGATESQLKFVLKYTKFSSSPIPKASFFDYQGRLLPEPHGDTWILCHPVIFRVMFQTFRNQLKQFLQSRINGWAVSSLLICHNKLDLIQEIHNQAPDLISSLNMLDDASYFGHFEMIKFLTKYGYSGSTNAINLAAYNGHFEICRYLFEEYPLPLGDYSVAVKYAASNGHIDIAKFLGGFEFGGILQQMVKIDLN